MDGSVGHAVNFLRQYAISSGSCGKHIRGFTLLEVLVSVVILAFGMVAVLSALQSSLSALNETRDAVSAAFLLKDRLESIVVQEKAPPTAFGWTAVDRELGDFEWKLDVSEMEKNSGQKPDTCQVQMFVRRRGGKVEYSAATLLVLSSSR